LYEAEAKHMSQAELDAVQPALSPVYKKNTRCPNCRRTFEMLDVFACCIYIVCLVVVAVQIWGYSRYKLQAYGDGRPRELPIQTRQLQRIRPSLIEQFRNIVVPTDSYTRALLHYYGVSRPGPPTTTNSAGNQTQEDDDDTYEHIPLCDPAGPFIFVPVLVKATIDRDQITHFQTRLKVPVDRTFEMTAFITVSEASNVIVGLYLGHLEYFNQALETLQLTAGPFQVEVKPEEILTVSVRNRGTTPVVVDSFGVSFVQK
jgi:hypothetical protein